MRHWVGYCALALLCCLIGSSGAAVQAIPLSTRPTALKLVTDGGDELRFTVQIGRLDATEVKTPQGQFIRLSLPGYHRSHRVGAPELPMLNRLIAIPPGAACRVEILNSTSRLVDLTAYVGAAPILPSQPSRAKSADAPLAEFVYDAEAYGAAKIARPLVDVVELGRMRSANIGRLEISPVAYYPQENKIRVIEDLTFRVVFEGADRQRAREAISRAYSPYFEPLYARLANSRGFHDDYPDLVRDVVSMVVIAPAMFEAQLQPLVDWKTERGFFVFEGIIGTPDVGVTAESIAAYIHDLYQNPPAPIPPPSFVLLVGDVSEVPTFSIDYHATDRPYCSVDGDTIPDIYYGRISASNPTQLQAILDKTLMYERFTMPDPAYLGEAALIAGIDGTFAEVWGNGQIWYAASHYFDAAHGIQGHTYWHPTSGSQAADIIQQVSDGVGFVNYTGHGSSYGWSNPAFTQADVNDLQNGGMYCLAIGNGCSTSPFQQLECLAETWLRAPDGGAVGYIGASASTYWDEDYWWSVGATADIVAQPTYAETGFGAYDGLFHDHGESAERWYVTNDAIIFCGNLAVMESGSGLWNYYWNVYNLMGDPSLSTYFGVPSANAVIHPFEVSAAETSLVVTAAPGSYVGLSQDGVLVAGGAVTDGDSVRLDFLQTPLLPALPLRLVATAQNRRPYIAEIDVVTGAQISIDPLALAVEVPTEVTVTVHAADGMTPLPGLEVWAESLDYRTAAATTDGAGAATFTVAAPYGPTLQVIVKDPSAVYPLHQEQLPVAAAALTGPDLAVTTVTGRSDVFIRGYAGTLAATVGETGHTLHAVLPDGSHLSTSADSLVVTPDRLGQITGTIAVAGYDLYQETFGVLELDVGGLLVIDDGQGAADLAEDLADLGYDVTVQSVAEATPVTWPDYELLVVACGRSETPLDDASVRADLAGYAAAGGRLLIEGGDLARSHHASDPVFAQGVLHVSGWTADFGEHLIVAEAGHPVMSSPNPITVLTSAEYTGPGDQDVVIAAGDAVRAALWSQHFEDAGLVVFDDDPASLQSGQSVYFPFNYGSMDPTIRRQLLQNAAQWLLTPDVGTGAVTGTVRLQGEADHSGVTVTAEPGGESATTASDGRYELANLSPGTHRIVAMKDGWATAFTDATLAFNQELAGVDLLLSPAATTEACHSPAAAIPDNTPAGLLDTVTLQQNGPVSSVEVFLDIDHVDSGDLLISLKSPGGVSVLLHNRAQSGRQDILGWYPEELSAHGDLGGFLGEELHGTWALHVSDREFLQTGILNSWCLRVEFADQVQGIGAGAIAAIAALSGISLSWDYDPEAIDGFHVYRRIAPRPAVRLTERPLADPTGRIEFTDPAADLVAGDLVHYSYGMLRAGREIGRSAELALTFAGSAPAALQLHPNFPNPFNPETLIAFSLPRATKVSLRIYDMRGRLIRTLAEGTLPGAIHTRRWDGTDGANRRVASGPYYCRLLADGTVQTRKMLLIK